MRYQGSGYFWINDMHPTMVMHPIKPEMDGTDLTGNKDANGKHLFVEFVKTIPSAEQGNVVDTLIAYIKSSLFAQRRTQ